MVEYLIKFKCKCDEKIHTLTYGIQEDDEIQAYEKVKCSDCHAIINIVDVIKLKIDDKFKTLESIKIGTARLSDKVV